MLFKNSYWIFIKKNKDVYTRRCFEIPACKTLLIAPKTREIQKILKNDIEVVLWNNSKDFIKKIKFLLKNKKNYKENIFSGISQNDKRKSFRST